MKKNKLMAGILKHRHNVRWDKVSLGVAQAQRDLYILKSPEGEKIPNKFDEIRRIEAYVDRATRWLNSFPRQ